MFSLALIPTIAGHDQRHQPMQSQGSCLTVAPSPQLTAELLARSRYGRVPCTPVCVPMKAEKFGREVLSGRTHSGSHEAGNTWAPELAEGKNKEGSNENKSQAAVTFSCLASDILSLSYT